MKQPHWDTILPLPHCLGSRMLSPYSQKSALPMAMEVYFKARKERDADYFRTMLCVTN